jgi:hypothetical protein
VGARDEDTSRNPVEQDKEWMVNSKSLDDSDTVDRTDLDHVTNPSF